MKNIIYIAVVALALISCGNKTSNNTTDNDTVATENNTTQLGKNQTKEAVRDTLAYIYDNVFGPYNYGVDNIVDNMTWDEFEKIHFTANLKSLLDKAWKKQIATQDIFFDCDYWINAQDYADLSLKSINVTDFTPEKATAEVNFLNFGNLSKAYVVMEYNKEKDTWQISDFLNPESKSSFVESIKEYLGESADK